MRHVTSRGRRLWLRTRRKLRAGGRILAAGAAAGLGTYAGLRLASPVFRGASRVRWFRQVAPSFAASTRRLGRHGSAADWALASGALTMGAKAWGETKDAARRRYRRWVRSG